MLCTVNIQHHCHTHKCAASGSEAIYQERQETAECQPIVVHSNPTDLILNTARMHDAMHFDLLREHIDSTTFETDLTIIQGAQQEIDARRQRANQTRTGLLGRGRGGSRTGAGRAGSLIQSTPVRPSS